MKSLSETRRANGTTKAEARRAARPWTFANGLDRPAVQQGAPRKTRKA